MTDSTAPAQEDPKLTEAENYRQKNLKYLFLDAGSSPARFQLAIDYYLKNPGEFVEGTVRYAGKALCRYTHGPELPGEKKEWSAIFIRPEFHEFLHLVSQDEKARAEFDQACGSNFPAIFMQIFREAYHRNKHDEKALEIVARHFLLRLHEQTERGLFLPIKNQSEFWGGTLLSEFWGDTLCEDLGNVHLNTQDGKDIRMGDAAAAYLPKFIKSYKKSKGAEKLNALNKTWFWTRVFAQLSGKNWSDIEGALAQSDNRAYGPKWLKVTAAAILPFAAGITLGVRHHMVNIQKFDAQYADVFASPVPIRLMPDPAIYSGSMGFGGQIEGLIYNNASSEGAVDFREGEQVLQDLRAHVKAEGASGQPFTIYLVEYRNLKGHILSKAPEPVVKYYFLGASIAAILSAGMISGKIERRRRLFMAMTR